VEVLGTGMLGDAMASKLVALGHEVMMGRASRGDLIPCQSSMHLNTRGFDHV
jgi:predicted dinucleotide-binding enzyme